MSNLDRAIDKLEEKIDEVIGLNKELAIYKSAVSDLNTRIDDLSETCLKYEKVIDYCYKACLCERFETYGFDYDEKHPRLEQGKGSRKKTPKTFIEDVVGFEWEYTKPEGVCDSWKRLDFKFFKGE